jgi:hypothetical protein
MSFAVINILVVTVAWTVIPITRQFSLKAFCSYHSRFSGEVFKGLANKNE